MQIRSLLATVAVVAAASIVSSSASVPARDGTRSGSVLTATPITPNGAWTVYHRDAGHTGYDSSAPAATSASAGWVSPNLDQSVYGEPLVYSGVVYVATSNNTVYALNQTDGTLVWQSHLGTPQTSGWQCGNVNPTGILGTGVIDTAHSRLYMVAFLAAYDYYYLYGFDLATGAIVQTTQIAPPGFDWRIQQQRGALALSADGSHVYVPFGGRAGDCGPYHGWVVGVPTTVGRVPDELYETPSTGSGVWSAGGVVVESTTGNVFFSTGNAIPCSGAVNSDSVIRTGPALGAATSFFQPGDWQSNWCAPDLDLGSASPVLISPSLMFMSGKYGQGFLLNPASLGGTNGQLYPARNPYTGVDVCHGINADATFGSFAYAAPYVYLECEGGGLVALHVNTTAPVSFSPCASPCAAPSWNVGGGTTFGPPIVAGGVVWVVDIGGGGLYGFDAGTGAQVYHSAGFGVMHFSTPSEAGGQVFVSADTVVREFNMVQGCKSVTATAAPPTSAAAGTTVTITGAASSCPNPSPQYEFWMRSSSSACCQLAQAYSSSASYVWNTTGLVAGTYYFAVWARDANSSGSFANSLGRYDASFVLTYTLTGTVCTGVTASAAPASPQPPGTTVAITGTATGCPSPQYQFFVLYPGSQTWLLAQAYSATPTHSWLTSGKPAGVYRFSIWARDASSSGTAVNSLGTWDAYTTLSYTLTSTACAGVTASSSPPGSAAGGTSVTITGSATGCANPRYEFWILYPGSQTWQLAQPYGTPAAFSWATSGLPKGTYHFSVWAKDANSTGTAGNVLGTWDAYAAITYTLT